MPVIAALIVGGTTVITSGIKAYKANKALKELQKQELPNHAVTPEMRRAYGRAEGMTGRGFTGAEEAAFRSDLSSSQNTAYQQGLNQSGGNMAQALLGGIQSRNIGALNQFAAQDAQQRRANIAYADKLAGDIQQQENLASGQEINYRMAQEQAYGKALQDNLNNIQSGFNYAATMGLGSINDPNAFSLFKRGGGSQIPPTVSKFGNMGQPPAPDMSMYSPVAPMYTVQPQAQNTIPQNIVTGGVYGMQNYATPPLSQGYALTGVNYKNPFE